MINPLIFEQWKPITELSVPDIKIGYFISNFGRVYSSLSNSFLTPVVTANGYYRVFLRHNDGSGLYHLLHRIVMIEFHFVSNYEEMQVNHKDGDKSFNDDVNLEWVTCSENIIHAYRTGLKTKAKGEDCSYATITNAQADQIGFMLSEQKYSQEEIAEKVGCPKHIVGNISTGQTWKFIYEKYHLERFKKEFVIRFSDEDLHKLCNYFEIHKNEFSKNSDLYRSALKELFNIEYKNSMSASMSRIYNHKTRKEITDMYNY